MSKDKLAVFVVMPFAKNYQDIYQFGIKGACEQAGVTCTRVDEQIHLENILNRIYDQIGKADLIIAELSEPNANVFYETGYADGKGKPFIPLTKHEGSIPFDLRHNPYIVYEGIADLHQKLLTKLEYIVAHWDEFKFKGTTRGIDFTLMGKLITNYLIDRDWTMMSFEGIRNHINAAYSDELLLKLIENQPDNFRRVEMKGHKPGLKRLG
jgi:hypothetical protein